MPQGTGDENGSGARTGIGTTVASWLFAISLLVVSAGLVTWAVQGGMKMASSIRAEIEAEQAREEAEAPVILVQPDAPPLVAVPRTERVLTLPPPLRAHDTPPVWTRRPEPTYPREALGAGIEEGEVDLRCVARATGQIVFCAITSETPEGYGFGREAVRATRDARMQPAEIDGEQVDSSIHFSVRFRLQ